MTYVTNENRDNERSLEAFLISLSAIVDGFRIDDSFVILHGDLDVLWL